MGGKGRGLDRGRLRGGSNARVLQWRDFWSFQVRVGEYVRRIGGASAFYTAMGAWEAIQEKKVSSEMFTVAGALELPLAVRL